jgi:hypothetical protein
MLPRVPPRQASTVLNFFNTSLLQHFFNTPIAPPKCVETHSTPLSTLPLLMVLVLALKKDSYVRPAFVIDQFF